MSWAGPTSVAAGSHESKSPHRERSRLQRLKSKCVRVNEGARQTATSPPSHSVVCWCLVSEEEGNSPSARLLKQLEACQKLQGCEDACSLCKEKKKKGVMQI